MRLRTAAACALAMASVLGAQSGDIQSEHLDMRMGPDGRTELTAIFDGQRTPIGPPVNAESIIVDGKRIETWPEKRRQKTTYQGNRGWANRLIVISQSGGLQRTETIDAFRKYGRMLVINVTYRNIGRTPVRIDGCRNAAYTIQARDSRDGVAFWSLQSGSYEKRPDWVVPLKPGFQQQNYLGMNADDYGGGTPVIDVWRPDVGLAVGHDELSPRLVSEPVTMPSSEAATVAIEAKERTVLRPGEEFRTPETFIAAHRGDYFDVLRDYRQMMIDRGVRFEQPPQGEHEPIWCAWGFGRKFQPEQIVNALPEAKKLGFGWVTMDDGWQTAEGDWAPNPQKFPRGDADVRALVERIHATGMKAQLWWAPLSVSPKSQLIRAHPDWLLLDEKGSRRRISWWDSFYLCPADRDVVEWHRKLTKKIFETWGFDGLKLDGQFLNAVPVCTNPAHHHASPLDSVQQLPLFFRAISEAAHEVKPQALIELCPCGTSYSFFSMPYFNMTVASDPESSWQVRSKGKTLKALMGDSLPFFGDHVELSDGARDFASTVGVGGVIGTEYRWPPDSKAPPSSDGNTPKLLLTPDKERVWAKWVQIYRTQMLPEGEYLGDLYDIGFDKPETHCIRKGGRTYYAFYASNWDGTVSFRGLGPGHYRLVDYVNNKQLGLIDGANPRLNMRFERSLLVYAENVNGQR